MSSLDRHTIHCSDGGLVDHVGRETSDTGLEIERHRVVSRIGTMFVLSEKLAYNIQPIFPSISSRG